LTGVACPLTKLELAVFDYLQSHANKAVSARPHCSKTSGDTATPVAATLWTFVIRSLRKKLGDRSAVIETVSGSDIGYGADELEKCGGSRRLGVGGERES
jgi:DNA-binding response OmpR family regulator